MSLQRPRHVGSGPKAARSGLLLAYLLWSMAALAGEPPPAALPECMAANGAGTLEVGADWRVVVDRQAGFGVLLPPSHLLSGAGDVWYAYETLDGEPLVPDVTIALHRGLVVEHVAGELFGEGVTLEPVRLGPATSGYRATLPGRTDSEGYLAVGELGTYSVVRYEDFDWDGFGPLGCSFHFVEFVGGAD